MPCRRNTAPVIYVVVEYAAAYYDGDIPGPGTLDKDLFTLASVRHDNVEVGAGGRGVSFPYGDASSATIRQAMNDAGSLAHHLSGKMDDDEYVVAALSLTEDVPEPDVLVRHGGWMTDYFGLDSYDQVAAQRGWEDDDEPLLNPAPARAPRDLRPAVRTYEDFNAAPHHKIQAFKGGGVRIPEQLVYAGPAVHVTYRSSKWGEPKPVDYIHEITSRGRVVCALAPSVVRNPNGQRVNVPAAVREAETVAQIGEKALGLAYEGDDGEEYEIRLSGRCKWFWSPHARALYAIRDHQTLVGVLWGGALDIEPRGIVG